MPLNFTVVRSLTRDVVRSLTRAAAASGGVGPDLSDLSATDYVYTDQELQGIEFTDDGLKVFFGNDGDSKISTYNLSGAWDLSTRAVDAAEVWRPAGASKINDVRFNLDGTRVLTVTTGDDKWHWGTLPTPFDLGTVNGGASESVPVGERDMYGLCFNADGTEMFGGTVGTVNKYTLSTPFLPSSRGAASAVLDLSAVQATGGLGITFSSDGLKFYSCDYGDNLLDQWDLSVAYDLSTAVHQAGQTIAAGTNPFGIFARIDAPEIYITHDSVNKKITRFA